MKSSLFLVVMLCAGLALGDSFDDAINNNFKSLANQLTSAFQMIQTLNDQDAIFNKQNQLMVSTIQKVNDQLIAAVQLVRTLSDNDAIFNNQDATLIKQDQTLMSMIQILAARLDKLEQSCAHRNIVSDEKVLKRVHRDENPEL